MDVAGAAHASPCLQIYALCKIDTHLVPDDSPFIVELRDEQIFTVRTEFKWELYFGEGSRTEKDPDG